MLSKAQRVALYNLGTIHSLIARESIDRKAAEDWRDIVSKNTLDPKHNVCAFDLTEEENKKLDQKPIRSSSKKHA